LAPQQKISPPVVSAHVDAVPATTLAHEPAIASGEVRGALGSIAS
jgi:hypothetical protein